MCLHPTHLPAILRAQDYCVSREQLDFVLAITSFKTLGAWSIDPLQGVAPAVKAALTRFADCPDGWSVQEC